MFSLSVNRHNQCSFVACCGFSYSRTLFIVVFNSVSDSSADEEAAQGSCMPPGVSQEDIDLFKQAQDNAQDLLNKVGICCKFSCMSRS